MKGKKCIKMVIRPKESVAAAAFYYLDVWFLRYYHAIPYPYEPLRLFACEISRKSRETKDGGGK